MMHMSYLMSRKLHLSTLSLPLSLCTLAVLTTIPSALLHLPQPARNDAPQRCLDLASSSLLFGILLLTQAIVASLRVVLHVMVPGVQVM